MTKKIEIFLIFFIACVSVSNCNNFTVQIMHQDPPMFGYSLRCFGALFDQTSILVPASCLDPVTPDSLYLLFQNQSNILYTNAVDYAKHPSFNASNPSYGNVGGIRLKNASELYTNYSPRALSRIPQNRTICTMFRWSEGIPQDQILMQKSINVLPPVDCGNDSAFTHCSFVTAEDNSTVCAFKLGSPLVCDNSTIAGYMISDGCETRSGATIVRFNSAAAYEEWREVEFNRTVTTSTTTTMRTTSTTAGAGRVVGIGILVLVTVVFGFFL